MRNYKQIKTNTLLRSLVTGSLLLIAVNSRGSLVFSEPTNGLYVGITCSSDIFSTGTNWITNNIPIQYDDELAIMFFSKDGPVDLLLPLNKEMFIKFEMHDTNGVKVPKTPLGDLWGDQVQNFPSKPGLNNRDRMSEWGAASWDGGRVSGPRLVTPDKLFQMKESGIYDLTLEVHLMRRQMQTNGWAWDHVAIPPVTIKVKKTIK